VAKNLAIGWFPAGELETAKALWPHLLHGWDAATYADYCRAIDRQLRELEVVPGTVVLLAQIRVKQFIAWCARERVDPASPDSRAAYATETATRGRVRQWPPKPRQRCWCGSGESYAECCGR
jgi:hypothetical protein